MAWTAANLTDLEAAIMALVKGEKSATIGDRSYTKENLRDLCALRDEMKTEINLTAGNTGRNFARFGDPT